MVDSQQLVVRYPEFAQRVQERMAAQEMTAADVFRAWKERDAKVGYEMVRRYSLGYAMPRQDKISILAEILGTSPAYLQHGEGPFFQPSAKAPKRSPEDAPAPKGAKVLSSSRQTSSWPFSSISEAEVHALPEAARNRLDGALALAIAQMNLLSAEPAASAPAMGRPIPDQDSADNPFPPPAFVEPKPWAVGLPLGSTVKQAPELQISTQADVGHLANAGYSANDHQFLAVPELDVRLAAGALGIENYSETQIGEILLRKSFLESFGLPLDRMKIVYGEGDSMEPVIRHRAPMLFFEEAITDRRLINQRMVYAINRGGKMLVKCLAKDMSGAWVARSLNPAYSDFPLEADDGSEVRIVGRILWSPYDLRNGVDERLVRR